MSTIIVKPDAKGRINLGALSNNISSYKVTVEENGNLILEPFVEIPLSEQWIFNDKEQLELIKKQLANKD